MNNQTTMSKTSRKTNDDSSQHSSAGADAVAITPPDYGIGFVDGGMEAVAPVQLVGRTGRSSTPAPAPTPNRTGLPDQLKSGIENLSGYSMDDVRVHYNSSKPAALNALAYAQGTEIHLGAGQERHLPHEAWHVVQQKQGRVRPTLQMKGGVGVNDDVGLEREADVIGEKASRYNGNGFGFEMLQSEVVSQSGKTLQAVWNSDKEHNEKWDQMIDGVQWYRDSTKRLWFVDKNKDKRYEFWSGQVHSYSEEEWNNIEIELSTPAQDTRSAVEKIKEFNDFEKYEPLILKGSRDRPAQLFDVNGDPINVKNRADGAFMIDTGMSEGEAKNYEKVRNMGVRVPFVYGWNSKGAIVQFLPNQTTVTAQLNSIDKAVESKIKQLKKIDKWYPDVWKKAVVDLNVLIKTGYHSGDLQFMVDNNGGHIYVMDLEVDKGPRFEKYPDNSLIRAKEIILKAIQGDN